MKLPHRPLALAVLLAGLPACHRSGAEDQEEITIVVEAESPTGFDVFSIDVASPQRLNAPIDITFTQDVDFATVGPNTIRIRPVGNAQVGVGQTPATPATGVYELVAPNLVRFRPSCPTVDESGALAGAGLLAGQRYTIVLPGAAAGVQVLSTQGRALPGPRTANFATPYGGALYADGGGGAPRVVVRAAGSPEPNASYLELGLDPNDRVYFERNLGTNQVELPPGFRAPLNHRSRTDTRVAWMIELDQPIDPRPTNLARVRLEYEAAPAVWQPFPSSTSLAGNCDGAGALLRVTPLGILPQDSALRVRVSAGFVDLVGEATTIDFPVLGVTAAIAFDPGTTTPGDDGDGVLERFDDNAREDPSPLPLPRATWGSGGLEATAATAFTGGPNGDFDWYIAPGTAVFLDTVSDTIVGGPGGTPTAVQNVLGGVVEVRDLFIPASSLLLALGPNPLTIIASRDVNVQGRISVDGGDSDGVGTLNTTNQPETGAAGRAGGGNGGTGSPFTNQSSPAGGNGFGAFNAPDLGGGGGETGYSVLGKNDRRGAGGGGGRLGADIEYDYLGNLVQCQTLVGMDAEPGFGGGPNGLGAISQSLRAMGGAMGATPFGDGSSANDFYGTLSGASLVTGELPSPWPGAGGGGGGDASNTATFPLVPFQPTGDEKGAGAGGGAGVIHILALGDIELGPTSALTADGGSGGAGENTSFFDRVGSGSGGGSGGSIVLETSGQLIVDALGVGATGYGDDPLAGMHDGRPISALGGQGGAGRDNRGGASETGNSTWRCDSIPVDRLDRGAPGCDALDVPPMGPLCTGCFFFSPDFNDPLGPVLGAGGDGGPGLIQLHANSATDITFTAVANGDLTQACAPRPIGWTSASGWQGNLVPTTGTRSMNQSTWIALGRPRVNPGGADVPVAFFVDDLDVTGSVPQSGTGTIGSGPPLFAPTAVVPAPGYPSVTADPFTMAFDSSSVTGASDIYERNPLLLDGARLRLAEVGDPTNFVDHVLASGEYDPALDVLELTVDGAAGDLLAFAPAAGVEASVLPRSFELSAGGVVDALSPFHEVALAYDAAPAGPDGEPDLAASFSALNGGLWTGDEQLLNTGEWEFVRFRVIFDVDVGLTGGGLADPLPRLDFVRLPFRF